MSINNKLSKKHREKISNALKKAHKKGNHPGWSHVNSSKNHMSRPERIFYSMLKDSGLINKYHIEYGFSVSKYFLDFAILDFKIDIEIDGVQHIRNENNIKHDKKRDQFLLEDNWKVYRISVKELFNEDIIKNLIIFIEDNKQYRKYNISEILEEYKSKSAVYGSRLDYTNAVKKMNDKKVKPIIDKLLNSDINFSKYGWVSKASKIIGITPQNVKKWMIRYMPDFYNECYKRQH